MQITNPRRFIFFLLILALIVIALIAWAITGSATVKKPGEITIVSGQAASTVWRSLSNDGFTDSTFPWRYWGWRRDAAAKIQAGTYTLERGEAVSDVVYRLITGDVTPDELTITYPEGFTLDQIAERTAARNIGTKEDFIAATKPQNFAEDFPLLKEIPAGRDLEGYLFPDTYRIGEGDTPETVIERLVANFHRRLSPELRDEAATAGRTIDEIIIMASIIEREVLTDDDMAKVSGILWKRNDDGVGLDADATVRYALNKWDGGLTFQDLQTDSPYNTRRWRGLPPGPISNPGLRAIQAAIRPEESDYYYYLSAKSGETIFSKTLDEHNANKAKYLR